MTARPQVLSLYPNAICVRHIVGSHLWWSIYQNRFCRTLDTRLYQSDWSAKNCWRGASKTINDKFIEALQQ